MRSIERVASSIVNHLTIVNKKMWILFFVSPVVFFDRCSLLSHAVRLNPFSVPDNDYSLPRIFAMQCVIHSVTSQNHICRRDAMLRCPKEWIGSPYPPKFSVPLFLIT